MLNQSCPKHGTDRKPSTHSWKDCIIMRSFWESIQRPHGPNGGLGSGSHCPGHGGGGSSSGFQGHGNQGGYNQQNSQGNQQQQSGYQSNPKQLNSGQYHVFTTSLCKQDQKLHRRAVNELSWRCRVTSDGQSSLLCGVEMIIRPGSIIRVIWL